MNVVVVLISVSDFTDGRKIAERIENTLFNTCDDIRRTIKENENGLVEIYPITEFMDSCNNEEINLGEFWVSYAQVNKLH
jgi:hypothetical protein